MNKLEKQQKQKEIITAVRSCSTETLTTLLKEGVSPNTLSPDGDTLLLYAIHLCLCKTPHNYNAIVEILVKYGANINIDNKNGDFPLILASHSRTPEITKILLNAGANVNIHDDMGINALHMAVMSNHPNTAKCLIKSGIDTNAINYMGQTPLHLAAERGGICFIRMLVKAGSDPYITDRHKNTPLDIFSVYKDKYTKYKEELKHQRLKEEDRLRNTKTGFEFDI